MSRQYAKLWTAGYDLADQKERNRRTARPETYRGAYADLCIAIDRSEEKEAPAALRYWAARWDWDKTEVKRFFEGLVEAKLFTIKISANSHRGKATRVICPHFVPSDVPRMSPRKISNDKDCEVGLSPSCPLECPRVVSELPNYQTIKKTSIPSAPESTETPLGCRQPSADIESFQRFWDAYPKKAGKKKCLEKWKSRRLVNQVERLLNDIRTRSASDRKWLEGFIPNPLTYLNGDRWDDEIEPVNLGRDKGVALTQDDREAMRLQQEYLEKKRHATANTAPQTRL